ncbi:glycosyltransferase family 9 protein [Thermodesulfobacteriota bacterium]
MNLNLQRNIDRSIGTSICWFLSLIPRKDKDIDIKFRSKNILVILLSEMGSLVLAKPMFDFLKQKYPDAIINVLLFERSREVMDILGVTPLENMHTVRNNSLIQLLIDSLRFLKKIRKLKIDTVIDCELFSRISSIFSFLSGARIRVGFHSYTQEGLYRGSFINRPVLYNPYNHISHQFITLSEAIESDRVPSVKRLIKSGNFQPPDIKFSQKEINKLRTRFKSDFPQIAGKKIVLVYPSGGLLPIRAWPLENFCYLTEDLIDNGYAVGVIGLEVDKGLSNVILSRCRSEECIDLTGYTKTIRELMVMFHFASLLITNDGGPGHFASMTPIPSIILYGPETPTLYGSLGDKSVSLYDPLSCSPCLTAYNHRNSPCDGDNLCLKNISPEEVLANAYEILGKQASSSSLLCY